MAADTAQPEDRYHDQVVALSLDGHDRDLALAMLAQARHRLHPIDDIQVAHLLAIGHRAGVAAGRAAAAEEIAREIEEELKPPLACAWTTGEAASIARSHAAELAEPRTATEETVHIHHEGQADHDRVEADITRRFHLKQTGRSPFGRGDRVGFTAGSGRHYAGERSDQCPGDGVPGHRHDVRCIQPPT